MNSQDFKTLMDTDFDLLFPLLSVFLGSGDQAEVDFAIVFLLEALSAFPKSFYKPSNSSILKTIAKGT